MSVYHLKYPGSKWLKYVVWNASDSTRPYLPHTSRFHQLSFRRFIQAYRTIFFKPSVGGGGRDIVKITTEAGGRLQLQIPEGQVLRMNSPQAYAYLRKRSRLRSFILQQGIDLLRIDNKPIDFRILAVRNHKSSWEVLGCMGKIAAPRKYVTNRCRGGEAVLPERALQEALGCEEKDAADLVRQMERMTLLAAEQLVKKFPNVTELGVDAAVDPSRRIWLLEGNSKPHYELFREHSDQDLYPRIDRRIRTLRAARG